MYMYEKEVFVHNKYRSQSMISQFSEAILNSTAENMIPIRFVVSRTTDKGFHCEIGILQIENADRLLDRASIFNYKPRKYQNVEKFNAVFLIPTGIGAELGGHAGDGGPTAKLLSSVCDTLITHPNVVNASDINELPDNALYVEGSVVTRLLMGTVGLQKLKSNRVILVVDDHKDERFPKAAINLTSASRASLGADCPLVLTVENNVQMETVYSSSGRAVGKIQNFDSLYEALIKYRQDYDAIALSSVIKVPPSYHRDYYLGGMINPWGGVEAMLTHAVSLLLDVPSAHSPMMESMEILNMDIGVVDPRMAAEIVSVTFLYSVMKGLHRSPRIITDPELFNVPGIITAADIDCLIIPDGCVGLPTLAAIEQGIPVISVRENKNNMKNNLSEYPFKPGQLIYAENYLEAAGIMSAMKTGVTAESVRRPLGFTRVEHEKGDVRQETTPSNKVADLSNYIDKKVSLS